MKSYSFIRETVPVISRSEPRQGTVNATRCIASTGPPLVTVTTLTYLEKEEGEIVRGQPEPYISYLLKSGDKANKDEAAHFFKEKGPYYIMVIYPTMSLSDWPYKPYMVVLLGHRYGQGQPLEDSHGTWVIGMRSNVRRFYKTFNE